MCYVQCGLGHAFSQQRGPALKLFLSGCTQPYWPSTMMNTEESRLPIGSTQRPFIEKPSLRSEPISEGHSHLIPTQATERPDLNVAEHGGESLSLQSLLIQEPSCETTAAGNEPPASAMIVSSGVCTLPRMNTLSKEELQEQGIQLLK